MRPFHQRPVYHRLTIAFVAATLALAGCSNDADITPTQRPTQTPSESPTPSPTPAPTTVAIGPLTPTPLTVAEGTNPGAAEGQSLNIPQGWTAEVWANVPNARLAAWTPDGKLLVSSAATGKVVALTPTGDGKAPTASDLLTGLNSPQGLAFALNGKVLVVGETDRIVAYDYLDGAATNRRVLVDNLPTGGHGAKGIAVNGDRVYYSLGSSGNRVPEDRDADPERATVWRVSVYGTGERIVARGVRNGFALAIAPDKTLFAAVNQMDNQPYPFDDGSRQLRQRGPRLHRREPRGPGQPPHPRHRPRLAVLRPRHSRHPRPAETSPTSTIPRSTPRATGSTAPALPPTMLGLPAHSAPLGLAFTEGTPLGPGSWAPAR